MTEFTGAGHRLELQKLDSAKGITVEAAAPGVYFVRGPLVNWTILTEGDAFTLVDAGYPADARAIEHSIDAVRNAIGPLALKAILITHAHTDHIGTLGHFAAAGTGVTVLTSPLELTHVRREVVHQVGLSDIARAWYRPGVLRWAYRAVRAGGRADVAFEAVSAHPLDVPLDVPGRPIARSMPGHTPGHVVYQLPEHGLVITGDALVSGHPVSRINGPQILPVMFNAEEEATQQSSLLIAGLGAQAFLPGHGPAERIR